MAGLAVQNFVSAAVGIAVVIALIRGIVARSGRELGNFWQDLVRILLYILLPVSIVAALFLVSQGVIQNLDHSTLIHTLTGGTQTLAQGPVASQEAIKELGTNGGGFFNVNSAFPFENPSGLTNFVEMLLILVIPASLTYTYGRMVGSQRQGWAIFAAMFVLFVAGVAVVYMAEQHGTVAQHAAGLNTHAFDGSTGGNMEGKEQRFGIAGTSLWTAVTTVTSCGAVNAAFESLTGLGEAVPFANLGLSEVVFGGVGAGLYSMLLYVLLAVFIGGLMVGRTPEYLGKKIEAREIKLVSLGVLVTPLVVLLSSGIASATELGKRSLYAGINPQGFSETLYAYLSQANNNGSAFAGYTGFVQPNAPGNVGAYGISFADLLGGVVMVGARFAPILFVLAVAGALAGKKVSPAGLGTMRTDNPTFVFLLIGDRDPGRRPHLLPRPAARAGRPEPDHEVVLMRKDLLTAAIAIVVMTIFLGLALPAGDHRHLPGRLPGPGERLQAVARRQGSGRLRSGSDRPGLQRAMPTGYFQLAPLGDRILGRRHLLRQRSAPTASKRAKQCAETSPPTWSGRSPSTSR